jgi:hypothetical protein
MLRPLNGLAVRLKTRLLEFYGFGTVLSVLDKVKKHWQPSINRYLIAPPSVGGADPQPRSRNSAGVYTGPGR